MTKCTYLNFTTAFFFWRLLTTLHLNPRNSSPLSYQTKLTFIKKNMLNRELILILTRWLALSTYSFDRTKVIKKKRPNKPWQSILFILCTQ